MVKHTAPNRILSRIIGVPPTAEEQERIAIQLDALSREVEGMEMLYRAKMDRLVHLKQSVLQKAFSGELTSPPSQAAKEAAE